MDFKKFFLYAAFVLVSYTLWTDWHQEYPTNLVEKSQVEKSQHAVSVINNKPSVSTMVKNVEQASKIIWVQTDVLQVGIREDNGNIVVAKLKNYSQNIDNNKPFVLLTDDPKYKYNANSALVFVKNGNVQDLDVKYSANKFSYVLKSPRQDEIHVVLKGKSSDGLDIEKQYVFYRGKYLINLSYDIKNTSDIAHNIYLNTQLYRASPQEDASSLFHVGSYTGASYSNPPKHLYKKMSFQAMGKENLDLLIKGGWFAMQQHYFLSAWILAPNSKSQLYTREENGNYTIGALSSVLAVDPNNTESINANIYIGPEDAQVLKGLAPGLDFTIDYGWLWFISSLIFSCMKAIYSVIGNWGVAIILVTVLIKLLFYKLSASSYKSMAGMRRLQPKLQALKDRYGEDKAKISQETMALYRQEKINPLGGCLPILVQIPVFIALYWVLLESVELRHAPFILWIKDLSAADPYHVLPIIMGLTMFVQQKLNPPPPDPAQAKAMMFLPIFFTFLFWSFPAGLVLYWTINNTLSIMQQWYITNAYAD